MTTTPQTATHEKARADSTGFMELLNSLGVPVTRQALADDPFLIKLEYVLDAERLRYIADNITITYGDDTGKIKHTAGTIAIILTDSAGQPVGAVFFKPNSKEPPIIVDPTGYGAIVAGSTNPDHEVIAFNTITDLLEAATAVIGDDKTLIASSSNGRHIFKQTVQHWSATRPVIVPMTLNNKGLLSSLAGVNAKALVTPIADIVTMLHDGDSYDDIRADADLIDLADTAHYPEWRKDKAAMLNAPMVHDDGRFELYHDGLFYVKYNHDDPANIGFRFKAFICSPIEVIAMVRDVRSGNWGRLLQWHDADGVLHKWAMPMSLLQADAKEYRRELAIFGLNITTDNKRRSYLDTYIQDYPVYKRGLCVDKLGWHDEQYILPDVSLGNDDSQLIVYQSANAMNSTLAQKGDLTQWREQLCKPLVEQSRLAFSIACAFAGQLLEPLGYDGGGFHIVGSSSMGKSVSLKVAASVWGNPDKYVKTWRQTDNALEGTACEHNDSFLGLDEISECDPKIIGKTSYMLANGQGKGRSTTSGHNRKSLTWRLMFLSNGENTIQQHMAQAGQKTNAGIEIRIAHIDADAGKGYRMFDSLVLADTGEAQADKIKALSSAYYGTAGMAWLEHITSDKAATTAKAKTWIDNFMSHYPDVKAQAHRVGKRFAIVAAAGEIATQAGITGWQAGQAMAAAQVCFDNWLDSYGRGGEHEQHQIIEHIKAFIEQHGASRFQPCHSSAYQDFEPKTLNRVGYHNYDTGEYYFSTGTFDKEVCAPFGKAKVLQVLDEAGFLVTKESDRKTCKVPVPFAKQRKSVYLVRGTILNYEPIKTNGTHGTHGTTHTTQGLEPVP